MRIVRELERRCHESRRSADEGNSRHLCVTPRHQTPPRYECAHLPHRRDACVIGDAMSDSLYFLRRFLRNPSLVASVVPSSQRLATEVLRGLDLADGDLVLEYGPGTGPFTREIARKIRDGIDLRYLGIERDAGMRDYLAERFPELEFVCDDVLRVEEIVAERELGPAMAVISSIPLILMDTPDIRQILTATHSLLHRDGTFRTISYLHSYPRRGARSLRDEMQATFATYSIQQPVWWNFPPALVLSGRLEPAAQTVVCGTTLPAMEETT